MNKSIHSLITYPNGFKAYLCISLILLIYIYWLKVILDYLQFYDILILTITFDTLSLLITNHPSSSDNRT
jgi:hypothetical protein